MARYAEVRLLVYSDAVELNQYLEFTLLGNTVRFQPGAPTPNPGNVVYFPQDLTGANGFRDGDGNAAQLKAAVEGWLAGLQLTEYQVTTSFERRGIATSDKLLLSIKATAFGAGYEFVDVGVGGFSAQNPPTLAVVTNADPPTVTPTVTVVTCFGGTTGAISLAVTGGVGPYTYAWADGPATPGRAALPAGSYPVTVTDSDAADPLDPLRQFNVPGVTTITVVVGQNSRIEATLTRMDTDLLLIVTGGTAPYTYLWNDGATTPSRTGLGPGVYSCIITDALGCRASVSTRIESFRYYFAGNPIALRLDAGDAYRESGGTTKPELRFQCEVWLEQQYLSGQYQLVGQVLEQPADAQGRTTFQVEELLEPFLRPHLPPLGQTAVTRAEGSFLRFYLKHREITTAGPGATTTLDFNYVLRGGLSFAEAAADRWFSTYQPGVKPFFTWQPATQRVRPDQPQYLYFMPLSVGVHTFRCKLRAFSAAGSLLLDTVFHTQPGARRYELYCLPVGYTQRALPAAAVRWQVQVVDSNGAPLSELRTFQLDRRPAPTRRFFLFENSLGALDSLCALGRHEQTLATKTLSTETTAYAGYDPLRGDVAISQKTGLPTLKCYTGARGSAAQLLADQEFMLSERVLLVDVDRYVAGLVKDKTYTAADDDDTRRVLQFDYELPRERYYTPRLPLPTSTLLP